MTVFHDDGPCGGGTASSDSWSRRWVFLAAGLAACVSATHPPLPAAADETRMVVAEDTIVRRTCPSVECGGVGRFNLGESVVSYETVDGWTRVSPYYTAGCHEGQAAFVQIGPSDCTRQNGIEQGEFAEWVRAEFLKAEPSGDAAASSEDCPVGACTMPSSLRAGD